MFNWLKKTVLPEKAPPKPEVAAIHGDDSIHPPAICESEALKNQGNIHLNNGKLEDAAECYRQAIALNPRYAEAYSNLGYVFQAQGNLDEAVMLYHKAIELNPNLLPAHQNLGLLLLSLGRYVEAWPHYEHRFDPRTKTRLCEIPKLPFPQWRGESLIGKSLVIWPEQGFGDYIQFSRYAPLLRECGVSHLTFVCTQPLKALLETVAGVDAVITELLPATPYDYWSFPSSLPLHFGTTVDTIPGTLPYLHALQERVDRWHDRLPMGRLRVGLVWKGNADHTNDANRSLPDLSTLTPLWSIPGITFVSLQKGQGEEEAKEPPTDQPISPLGSDIGDFADTAAIVALLDMVICVDTSIAHLAGALGKPCWVLLPHVGTDWRWLQEREDSPWYTSVRLFRQKEPGDWSQPVERIRQELMARIDS